LAKNDIAWSRIQKGKPQQNAIIERFNRTFTEDVLDANIFRSLDEAREITELWKEEYNTVRPHESLNHQTPANYAA
jgi:putative transposase